MTPPRTLSAFLWQAAIPYKYHVLGLMFVGLFWASYTSVSNFLLKTLIDQASGFGADRKELWSTIFPIAAMYMASFLGIAINMRFRDWLVMRMNPAMRQDITISMFAYLQAHSYRYFQNNFAGSLSSKISDMAGGVNSIFDILEEIFANSTMLIIALGFMFYIHPFFGVILLGWIALFILISAYFISDVKRLSQVFSEEKTQMMGKIVDSISNSISVRIFAGRTHEYSQIHNAAMQTVASDRAMQRRMMIMRIGWDASILMLIGAMFSVLIYLYAQHKVTIGDFTFIISISISIFWHLWFVASQAVRFSEECGKCQQALSILTAQNEITDSPAATDLLVNEGRIAFHDVDFYYHAEHSLFQNKNIVIEPGQKVGLVGFSGSGKTTFVHLILRFFDVTSGCITIDGQNIAEVTQESLRSQIAMIPQDASLFHRSLMENIRYGKLNASDEDVFEAARKAHCDEFISTLPEGYNTLVGERGIKLSGGQRQRIAIARAILKDAPILILDEATSALDSITEKHIQESLHMLMQNRTTIVVAHRLSTLSEMDRILVFNQGHIIEDGTHESLLTQNAHYAKLWHMQAGGFLPEVG